MSNHLLRSHAPISDADWQLLDDEARERLTPALAARRLVDFSGSARLAVLGAPTSGASSALATRPCDGVAAVQRRVLRAGRGPGRVRDLARRAARRRPRRRRPDLEPLDAAARQIAVAENKAVFHGWADASIRGSPRPRRTGLQLGEAPDELPAAGGQRGRAAAAERDRRARTRSRSARRVQARRRDRRGRRLPAARSPAQDHRGADRLGAGRQGRGVVSQRGGDFLFESGQDLSIGYLDHDADVVRLYLEQSFSFHVATPEAAVALTA